MIKNRTKTTLIFSIMVLFLGIPNGYGMENRQEYLWATVGDYESIEPLDYFSPTEYYQLNVAEDEDLVSLMDEYHKNALNLSQKSRFLEKETYDLLSTSLITLEDMISHKYNELYSDYVNMCHDNGLKARDLEQIRAIFDSRYTRYVREYSFPHRSKMEEGNILNLFPSDTMKIIFDSIFSDVSYFDFFKVFNDLKVVCKQWCLAISKHEMTKKYEAIEFYPYKESSACRDHILENYQCSNPELYGLYRSVALGTYDRLHECTLLKKDFFNLIQENYIVKSLRIPNLLASDFDSVFNNKSCLRELHIVGFFDLDQFEGLPYWSCFDHLKTFTVWKVISKEGKNIENFKKNIIEKRMKNLVYFKETHLL